MPVCLFVSSAVSLIGRRHHAFAATVSSEEVERGKPSPDVYLEAARRLGVVPAACAAVEDSSNGLRAASAAGMRVVAYPNRRFPPADDALRARMAGEDVAALYARLREVDPALAASRTALPSEKKVALLPDPEVSVTRKAIKTIISPSQANIWYIFIIEFCIFSIIVITPC